MNNHKSILIIIFTSLTKGFGLRPKKSLVAIKNYKNLLLLFIFTISINYNIHSQGITNNWQLGYDSGTLPHCVIDFSVGVPISTNFSRPMNMRGTCISISDDSGNLLFYSNGIYIANANHDTMQNGGGLNPGLFADAWATNGLPIFQGMLALPWPDSGHKYMIIHETLNYDQNVSYRPKELLFSKVDMNLDGGLGGVEQKNLLLLNDTIEGGMLSACKHANGRDWWVLIRKFNSDVYYNILISPIGVISISTQTVPGPISIYGGQSAFSPDGNRFATFDNQSMLRIYNFDRCTGLLSNLEYIVINDNIIAGSVQFSPSSQLLYISNSQYVYQFDLSSSSIAASQLLIATNDGYYSPAPPYQSDFFWQMTGPDGKIYINSGPSVVDLHVINSPDNLGSSCDLQQHSFYLGSFNKNTFPNNINYSLGPILGSLCDSLTSHDERDELSDISFRVFPTLITNKTINIVYNLPNNESGLFELYDTNGKNIMKMKLPQWSNMQRINLPYLNDGIYFCVFLCNNYINSQKILINNSTFE